MEKEEVRLFQNTEDGKIKIEQPSVDPRELGIEGILTSELSGLSTTIDDTYEFLVFRKQGMMLVSKQQYFEGGRSICRNPILQKMFMRLGRAEKAGSGVDKIVSGWQSLGWPRPIVAEETCPVYVVLTMQLGTKQHKKTRQAGFEEEANHGILYYHDALWAILKRYSDAASGGLFFGFNKSDWLAWLV